MTSPYTPRTESEKRQLVAKPPASGGGNDASESGEEPPQAMPANTDGALRGARYALKENLQSLERAQQDPDGVEVANNMLLVIDQGLRIRHLTPSAERFFGRNSATVNTVEELAWLLKLPNLPTYAKLVLAECRNVDRRVRYRGRLYILHLRPELAAEGGAVYGILMSLTEVKPGVSGHERLAGDTVMTLAQEPILLLRKDGQIVSVNRAFQSSFDYGDPYGTNILDLGQGEWNTTEFRHVLERVRQGGEPVEGVELTLESPTLGPRTLRVNGSLLATDQVMLSAMDVTPQRQLENLRQRESLLLEEIEARRRLREMASVVLQSGSLQNMFDYVLKTALELLNAQCGSLRMCNDKGRLEVVARQGFDEKVMQTISGLQYDAAPAKWSWDQRQRVAVEDICKSAPDRYWSKVAQEVGVRSMQSIPLTGRGGKFLGILALFYHEPRQFTHRDEYILDLLARETADLCDWVLTQRRLRQNEHRLRVQSEELLANDRQKNQFLGLLGHELRNPLSVMRNSIQVLVAEEQAFVSHPGISEALALLERQSRHMTHLVNDLLDVTRVNNGKVVLKRERVALSRCLQEVVAAHRSTLNNRDLHLSVSEPDAPIYLDADAARLFQVLDNLLTNAIKFTQPGGRIDIESTYRGGNAMVSVRDTGIGIPSESIGSLFHPFTQVENSLSCHGLGLGLSLVKTLVDLHGGEIHAFSEGEDRGSEFCIHWPLHARQAESAAESAPPSLQMPEADPRRILVVDDIADIADSFARLLEVAGHEVRVAYDGDKALQLTREWHPTVAFLDMVMPDMTGLELAEQLRQEFSPDALTLVTVSGYGQAHDIERARAAGFQHHLLKPIEVQQVYTLLDALVEEQHFA